MKLIEIEKYRVLMTGNEAIARGLIEGGVSVATAYPGTPSSEILSALVRISKENDLPVYAEWAVNEKVAFEISFAASLCGLRAAAIMKHLGTHWILDPLAVSAVTGIKGGLVVVSADDPAPLSSQSSTDTRNHAKLAHIIAVEPSDPAEAKELVKETIDISEKVGLPAIFRYTDRIAHGRAPIVLGELNEGMRKIVPNFKKDPDKLVSIAPNARKNIPELFKKLEKAKELVSKPPWIIREGSSSGEFGIITSGSPYHDVKEALSLMGIDEVPLLKLCVSNPLPEKPISDFLSSVDEVLVAEELDPIIELEVFRIAFSNGIPVKIYGKSTGHLKPYGELTTDKILRALLLMQGKNLDSMPSKTVAGDVPRRIPQLCSGCSHRGAYISIKNALKKAFGGRGIVLGDRGCYNQGGNPPLRAIDTAIAMGSSIGMAVGLAKSGLNKPIITVIGDSTFFHAGIPPLIDAYVHKAPIVVALLDNSWTSMTGHQPNPRTGRNAMGDPAPTVLPERIAEGIGIQFIQVADPYDIAESEKAIIRALLAAKEGPAMVIFRRECVLQELRRLRKEGIRPEPLKVDPTKCTGCRTCIKIGCPALEFNFTTNRARIIEEKCVGCSICAQICPSNAILPKSREV